MKQQWSLSPNSERAELVADPSSLPSFVAFVGTLDAFDFLAMEVEVVLGRVASGGFAGNTVPRAGRSELIGRFHAPDS